MPLQTVVQEPAYELGNNGQCPNDRAVQLISPSRFRLIGTVLINGHRSWHLHGQQTTGDTTDVHLYIDRASLLWNRIATTFVIRNNGRVVNRLPSRIDYSRFNRPVAISP
jgi:hypothetical protein